MDYTLPNGFVLRGIPEGMSEAEILRYAEYNGLMGPMDAQEAAQQPIDTTFLEDAGEFAGEMGEAFVDNLPAITGAVGSIAGGALRGAPAGPLGMLIGGAIGAFTFAGGGEVIRQLIEDEDPDAIKAVNVAAKEGTFDVLGGRAFDVLSGAAQIVKRGLGYGERSVDDVVVELQAKLQARGGTLRSSQIDPNARIINGLESIAQEAITSKDYLGMVDKVSADLVAEQLQVITRVSDDLEGEQLGILLKNLVENTRTANAEIYGELFADLQKAGSAIKISQQGPRNYALSWRKEKLDGLTKSMKEAAAKGAKIPFTSSQVEKSVNDILKLSPNATFSSAFDKLKSLKNKLTALRGNPATANDPAVAEIAKIVKGFEESMLKSLAKQKQVAAKAGNTEQSKRITEVLDNYTDLMKRYEDSQKITYSDVAVDIINEGKPEIVGRSLAQVGLITPVKEVRKIIAEAKKRGVIDGVGSERIMEGLRQGFLQQHLSAAPDRALDVIRNFEQKLAQPDFARTYGEIVPASHQKLISTLLKEVEILTRGGVGGEFSLAVRSSQLAGAQGLASGAGLISNTVKLLTPAFLAKYAARPERAKEMIGTIRMARRYMMNPDEMPPAVRRALALKIGKLSAEMAMENSEREMEEFDRGRDVLTQPIENFM